MHLKHHQEVQQYLNDMIKAILDFFDGLLLLTFYLFYRICHEIDHFIWKHFGKHSLTDDEKTYNRKIEIICEVLDQHYNKLLNDPSNLLMKTDMPYSEVKLVLNSQFDLLKMTAKEKARAMREVNCQNVRNSTKDHEYQFALGGRSECFLLQSFLKATEYNPEPSFIFWK